MPLTAEVATDKKLSVFFPAEWAEAAIAPATHLVTHNSHAHSDNYREKHPTTKPTLPCNNIQDRFCEKHQIIIGDFKCLLNFNIKLLFSKGEGSTEALKHG